ncbi:MAG: 30S ribosome-binding factor RbfA [Candidatus Omnitrophota bacterium]|nr:30S ribosome-binding factor RbfA [Candidatus Omnitrophota bacterium]
MSRQERIAEAIRQEASLIIHDKLKDPRLGFTTITRVEVTPDLRYAKIFFSVLGNEESYKKTKDALDSALGFVRKLVARRLNLRFAPEIAFYDDRSTEYSVRIEEVLNEIKELDGEKKPKKGRRGNKKA